MNDPVQYFDIFICAVLFNLHLLTTFCKEHCCLGNCDVTTFITCK